MREVRRSVVSRAIPLGSEQVRRARTTTHVKAFLSKYYLLDLDVGITTYFDTSGKLSAKLRRRAQHDNEEKIIQKL